MRNKQPVFLLQAFFDKNTGRLEAALRMHEQVTHGNPEYLLRSSEVLHISQTESEGPDSTGEAQGMLSGEAGLRTRKTFSWHWSCVPFSSERCVCLFNGWKIRARW